MELKDVLKMLHDKPFLGEYGAFNRPYVVLDVDEYRAILDLLSKRKPGRPKKIAEVPREAIRS